MFLKNVSFENLEAVKEDGHDLIPFLPQEVKEVSEEDGKWFLSRYPSNYLTEVFEVKKDFTETPEIAAVPETPGVDEPDGTAVFKCKVCGKMCKSDFGLKAHARSHK